MTEEGFCSYNCRSRGKGRTPMTGDSLTLPPLRVVAFRVSRTFRAELNLKTE